MPPGPCEPPYIPESSPSEGHKLDFKITGRNDIPPGYEVARLATVEKHHGTIKGMLA